MSVFICEGCDEENNSVYSATYHCAFLKDMWTVEFYGRKNLCWDCGPQTFVDGEPVPMKWEKGPDGRLRLK